MCNSFVIFLTFFSFSFSAPFGEHNPYKLPSCEVLDEIPSPKEFYEKYVKPEKAVVLKDIAKSWSAFRNFKSDEYLRTTYGETEDLTVEPAKKENRFGYAEGYTLSQFLDEYKVKQYMCSFLLM